MTLTIIPPKQAEPVQTQPGSDQTKQMATRLTQNAAPRNWLVVLQLVDGKAQPQDDWRTKMKVGDTVQFVSADGEVNVMFTPIDGKDRNGHPITGLNPFGSGTVTIRGDGEVHNIMNSCMSNMTCRIVDSAKVTHTYDGPLSVPRPIEQDPADDGTHVCTGGGLSPVVCS